MPPQSANDTFSWIGGNGAAWGAAADWFDVTVGATSTIVPDALSTVIVNGPTSGTALSIDGPGAANALQSSGLVNLVGTFSLGAVTQTGTDAVLALYGPTSASSGTIAMLTQLGTGDTIEALGLGTTLTVTDAGTIDGSVDALNGAVALPATLDMAGGTLDVVSTTYGAIWVGGTLATGPIPTLQIAGGGTLSGSGTLYAGVSYVPPAGGLPGSLTYNGVVGVAGEIYSTGITVVSELIGAGGTVIVAPSGFFTASIVQSDASAMTFEIGNDGSLHLPSVLSDTEVVDFTGTGGIAAFYEDDYLENYNGLPLKATTRILTGPIENFAQGDRVFTALAIPGGYLPPVYTQNGGAGTLTLNDISNSGITAVSFTIQGSHATSDFLVTSVPAVIATGSGIVNIQVDLKPSAAYPTSPGSGASNGYDWVGLSAGAWGDAANWFDSTTHLAASVAPGAGDAATITGSTGALYEVITQTGSVGALTIADNVAIEGVIAATAAAFAAGGGVLMATNGGTLTGTSLNIAAGDEAIAGGTYPAYAGGYIDITGAATLAAGAVLNAGYGGRFQAAGLTTEGGDGTTNAVQIDPGGAITVGTLNDAPVGDVMIDPGATFTDQSPAANQTRVAAAIVDDGTLIASNLWDIGFSGTGAATVEANGTLVANQLAVGSAVGFTIEAGGLLDVLPVGQFASGSVTFAGVNAGLSIYGNGVFPDPTITATLIGFAPGNSIELEDPGIASAPWTQSTPAGGTVSLLNGSGAAIGSFQLQGKYASGAFVVTDNSPDFGNIVLAEPGNFGLSAGSNGGDSFTYTGRSGGAWGDAANWSETVQSSPAIAPGAKDSISVGTGGSNGVTAITGTGDAATWTLNSNVAAVAGSFSVGTIVEANTTITPSTFIDAGGTLIVANISLGSTQSIEDYAPGFVVNGPDATLIISGTLSGESLFGGYLFGLAAGIAAENGGTVSIAALDYTVLIPGGAGVGTGTLPLAAAGGGTLILPTTIASAATPIDLSGTDNLVAFDAPAAGSLSVAPSISGFALTDLVNVTFAPTNARVVFTPNGSSSETAAFQTSGGAALGSLTFSGDFTGHTFHAAALSPTETQIALDVNCFRAGTRIATPRGEVVVEALAAGDRVVTLSGAEAPIVWAGCWEVDCRAHPRPESVWPVRVRAGALGEGLPLRDLFLSPDHAVYVGGVLIPIKRLMNGGSIAQVKMDAVSYHHIELDRHNVLLAEGLPAESYLDTGGRAAFAKATALAALHSNFASLCWEAEGYAPLIVTGPDLDAVRRRIAALAAEPAFAQ